MVSRSPNQPNVMQVLIRFSGPPDTLAHAELYDDLDKVQGMIRLLKNFLS